MASDIRPQVAAQCDAVNHMATAISRVHQDYAQMIKDGCMDGTLDIVGRRTAAFMEHLGEMLNAMDAYDEADDWMIPVFREAQRLWPAIKNSIEDESVRCAVQLLRSLHYAVAAPSIRTRHPRT